MTGRDGAAPQRTGGILAGVRVLDLTRMLSGPYCTMMLCDHGAEVVKIEGAEGDTSRTNGPYRDDDPAREWAGYFISLNRGKKSVRLDLKSPEGRDALVALVRDADVLVENFRPGVMERLGLSYEALARVNPRLVYAAIRGFGDPRSGKSPYNDWPSYDVVAQAMGGLMSITGPDAASPLKSGPGVGDVFSGMMMSFAIVAAIRHAELTGEGQFIDLAMYDAVLSLCERIVYQQDIEGLTPVPVGNGHPLLAPFGLFPASDGWVSIGVVDDEFWRRLTKAMSRPDLAADEGLADKTGRRENAERVNAAVAEWTGRHTKAELTAILGGLLPYGPVNDAADILADPHVAARAMIAELAHPEPGARPWRVAANPVHFQKTPAPPPAGPPRLGADNDYYLSASTEPAEAPHGALDQRALRDVLGQFMTGVTVITALEADGTPRGFTANSFTSVSLDPPLVLVCVAGNAASRHVFCSARNFAINILADDQKDISGLFATKRPDKFEIAPWRAGSSGVPLLEGALAFLECSRHSRMEAGDHVILIGRVTAIGRSDGRPLGYYRGRYFTLGVEEPLVDAVARRSGTVVGAIYEREGAILLETSGEHGAVTVPSVGRDGGQSRLDDLARCYGQPGFETAIDFVYAVYEDKPTGSFAIYYRGRASGEPPAGTRFFALDDIPFDRIHDPAMRSMLQRYCDEARQGEFAVYMGDETEGIVKPTGPDHKRRVI
ncbi:MAG: cag pathogenicity island protein Cag11 [Rhizobiales bacterium]|nr:cag pathogenicity island protein Cag11 [Hyphomicrobiales bacterium]